MLNIFLVSTLCLSIAFSALINIPSDYTTIQQGVDYAENGDTVLVSPGTYVENIIIEKEIFLTSYAIYDDLNNWINNENILSTIIVGNQPSDIRKGSCIQVSYNNIQPTILGFTLKEGIGTSVLINDCDIIKKERSGGAIMAFQAYPNINYNRFIGNGRSEVEEDNINLTIQNGASTTFYDDDDIEFDEDWEVNNNTNLETRDIPTTINLQNNFYSNNMSGNGESFYSEGFTGTVDVSGSVFENIDCENNSVNEFVLHSVDNSANFIMSNISGNCINNNIFYVNSILGDDNNIGTEVEPFLTIRHALRMVKANDNQQTTIHLSSGEYSKQQNGEVFPIVLPDNVHINGEDRLTTVINANADEENQASILIIPENQNIKISNITLKNGYSEGHGCAGGGAILVTANNMRSLSWDDVRVNNVILENLIIEESHSHNGGGISFFRVEGPMLENTIIKNNTSTLFGGGIFQYVSDVSMNNVEIKGNASIGPYIDDAMGHGGGFMLNQSRGTFTNLNIHNNSTPFMGGGIWSSYGSWWSIENSIIENNNAGWNGGGVALFENNSENGSPLISNTVISGNNTQETWWSSGGAVWAQNSNVQFNNVSFERNTASVNGGGVYFWDGSFPTLEKCHFKNNIAGSNGGGVYIASDASGYFINQSLFYENTGNYGGGISFQVPGVISNNTFYANIGGAVGTSGSSETIISNSILWDNSPTEIVADTNNIIVIHSNIKSGYEENGNINSNPLFINSNTGDLKLMPLSPCINSGTTDSNFDGFEDIFNYYGDAPDMGAFEFNCNSEIGDLNLSGDVNILDIVVISNIILGQVNPLTDEQKCATDLNVDSFINIQDILLLIAFIINY